MIPALITLLNGIYFVAHLCAFGDAKDILANRPIDHASGLWEKFLGSLVAYALAIAVHVHFQKHFDPVLTLKVCACFALIAWGWFTMGFRWTLNTKRGKDWRYVSPSNWYDWQFIRKVISTFAFPESRIVDQWEEARTRHTNRYDSSASYRHKIHRAGTLAYSFEAAVMSIGIVLFTLTNT